MRWFIMMNIVTTEIGQIGTQFDGPGHIGVNTSKGMFFYNGNLFPQSYERGEGGRAVGMGPNGVEHVGELGFVCRLVVLDAVAYRKSQGRIPATAEMLPIPRRRVSPGSLPVKTCRPSSKRRASPRSARGLRRLAHRPRQLLEQRSLQSR